jgi:endoglucanase
MPAHTTSAPRPSIRNARNSRAQNAAAPASNGDFGEFELLKRLTEAAGVPGREERIREIVLSETAGMWDQTQVDNMGNLICLKRATRAAAKRGAGSKRPERVMIACHMDEIGFYVRYIDEDGRLRVMNAGGFDTRNLFARRVRVQTRDGDLLGVMNPAGKPIHLSTEEERKKTPEMADFFVDLFMPKEKVRKLVQIGDPVTLVQTTEMAGDAITGKSMDNRVALWVGIHAVRKVEKAGGSPYDVYFVACVQEEVGLRGAQTAAFTVEPDVGIAIDTTLACDTPGITKDDAVTTFGGGVGIKVMDSSTISHRGLFDEFLEIARRKKIPHQLEVLPRGGTDAGALQRSRGGTRAITLSVPTRYIHTVTESVHKRDLRATVDLLAAWLAG